MAIQAGLVGLPNVGKSTLFNALTKSSIPAENYPFCTIDPHVAITEVPDQNLDELAKTFKSGKKIPAVVRFVDIAGLVEGASKGEGLGNQFLSHIQEVDLVLHVLRCFEDSDITHVHQDISPIDDFETICAELMLKDLESVEKREEKLEHQLKKNKNASTNEIKEWKKEQELILKLKETLDKETQEEVRKLILQAKEEDVHTIPLLSAKNFLIIANLSEEDFAEKNYQNNQRFKKLIEKFGEEKVIPVSAKIESEIAQLDEEEAVEMMESLEIKERGLDNIIKKSYSELGCITFFTCGPKEAHAWSISKNTKIPQAAGTIHSDMERGFICAEVYNCKDIFEHKSEAALKSIGKIKTEGRDYIVQDGDVVLIRFNV